MRRIRLRQRKVTDATSTTTVEIAQKARGMKPEDAKAYRQMHAKLRTAKAELETWMRAQPNRNEENLKKLDAYERKIEKLSAALERY